MAYTTICLTTLIKKFRCYEVKNRGKWKGRQLPGVKPRTPLAWAASFLPLSHNSWTTTSQSSIYSISKNIPSCNNGFWAIAPSSTLMDFATSAGDSIHKVAVSIQYTFYIPGTDLHVAMIQHQNLLMRFCAIKLHSGSAFPDSSSSTESVSTNKHQDSL